MKLRNYRNVGILEKAMISLDSIKPAKENKSGIYKVDNSSPEKLFASLYALQGVIGFYPYEDFRDDYYDVDDEDYDEEEVRQDWVDYIYDDPDNDWYTILRDGRIRANS